MDTVLVLGGAAVLGGVAPFAFAEVAVLAAVVGLLLARAGRPAFVLAALLAMTAGGARAWGAVARHAIARDGADRALPRPARCSGEAIVTSSPVRVRGSPRWDAWATIDACDDGARAWDGAVTLYGGPGDLARGDRVAWVAQLAAPQRLWSEETGDPRPGEARRGALRTGGAVEVRVLARGAGVLARIDRARAHVRRRIDATFPPDTAALARALVLGESDLAPEDDAAFRASGLAHLLAVSGMHLVLVVAGGVAAIRAVLVRAAPLAARLDVGRLAAAIGVPAAWTYAQLAGGSGSAMRAAWMTTAVLVARALGRRGDAARAFGLSLLVMAAIDPLVAFDVSFALSAAATAGLLAFGRPLSERLAGARTGFAAAVARSAATTIAATLPCAPLLARLAPTLPVGSVLANLVAVPVGEAAALPLCLVHALLEPWGAAERGCAWMAAASLRVVRAIAIAFAHAPGMGVPVPPPTSWQMVTCGVAFAVACAGRLRGRAPALVALAAIALLLEIGARRAGRPSAELRATFLDVGQGDAALVDLPSGEAILIDGGGLVGSPIDVGQRVVAPVLRARRRDAIALAVLSHPHPDHFGGLVTGLGSVHVGALWDTGQGAREGTGGGYAELLADAARRGIPVVRPERFCGARALGGATLDVLAPCPALPPDRDPNDGSIVLRIEYGRRALLFMGDAERAEEADVTALDPARLRADVLKVGHHGSRTSTSAALLRLVRPREAIVSSGVRNRFGHPHPQTLDALAAAGARVWRTDEEGSITVTTDGASLSIATARGCVDGDAWPF